MNWYKKQLDKIADSCISNKTRDIKNLSDILESDFNIQLSRKEAGILLNKVASNKKELSFMDDIILELDSSLTYQESSRLKEILQRYSKL